MSMRTVTAVLLRGGFILCAMIFCSSLMVTLISRYRQKRDLEINPAWLSRKWLMTLFLGFGTPVAALGVAAGGRVVLVYGDDFHVLEGELAFLAAASKHAVQCGGGHARCETQAEQAVLLCLDGLDDGVSYLIGCGVGIGENVSPDFLIIVQDACRKVFLNETAFVGKSKMLCHDLF